MLINIPSFVLFWIAITIYTVVILSASGKEDVKSIPWHLKLGFSAFLSLFLISIFSGSLIEF